MSRRRSVTALMADCVARVRKPRGGRRAAGMRSRDRLSALEHHLAVVRCRATLQKCLAALTRLQTSSAPNEASRYPLHSVALHQVTTKSPCGRIVQAQCSRDLHPARRPRLCRSRLPACAREGGLRGGHIGSTERDRAPRSPVARTVVAAAGPGSSERRFELRRQLEQLPSEYVEIDLGWTARLRPPLRRVHRLQIHIEESGVP